MRNCNKVITVRLTDEEYNRCELMAKGNKSFYVRQLIRNDISNNDVLSKENIIKIIEEYLAKENTMGQPLTEVKPEHTKTAKQVISEIFNF
jgi:hypothetical protein